MIVVVILAGQFRCGMLESQFGNHRQREIGRQTHCDARQGLKTLGWNPPMAMSTYLSVPILLRVLHYLISGGRSNQTINDRSFKSVYLQCSVQQQHEKKRYTIST